KCLGRRDDFGMEAIFLEGRTNPEPGFHLKILTFVGGYFHVCPRLQRTKLLGLQHIVQLQVRLAAAADPTHSLPPQEGRVASQGWFAKPTLPRGFSDLRVEAEPSTAKLRKQENRSVPSTYRSDRLKPPAADIRDGAHRRGAPPPPCPGSVAAHSATPARP